MRRFSKILKRLRGEKPLVIVATSVGISPSALSNYESGIRVPRDQIKVKLANYYGVSVESIFFTDLEHKKCTKKESGDNKWI